MCGVVSIVYPRQNPALGREAAHLVMQLEYRGYDSTGVATIGEDGAIALRKQVGAPSRVVVDLDVPAMAGQKAIGQVRWATYGSVTDTNAQPHEVRCKVHMVGAHNGNISNTDALKEFLQANGHTVASDNDGEMLVHVVEHYFAEEGGLEPGIDAGRRRAAALRAIRRAHETVVGSYAACVALPGLPGVFAMKAGSSLYAGKGSDAGGDFVVVSSDLTSVLSKTRVLIPLAEGEGLHFTHADAQAFSLVDDREWQPSPRRSRLNVADIALQPPYRYFMEQEIAQSGANLRTLERAYLRLEGERGPLSVVAARAGDVDALLADLTRVSQLVEPSALAPARDKLLADERLRALGAELGARPRAEGFVSDDAAVLQELAGPGAEEALATLDALSLLRKKQRVLADKARFVELVRARRQVYLVGSGTSYNACVTAGAFFAEAGIAAHAANPGHFRGSYLPALQPGDVVVGVTQSGETKDLVDVFDDVRERHGAAVHLLSIVNNENSTIPQEKSEFFLPLLCGPEIAVAATKSFVSQLALLWVLARAFHKDDVATARELAGIRELMTRTLETTSADVREVARLLCLRPSLHILGTALPGIAREGALKVREVVLNHTEGYDAAEFKHGPNTILGKNTVFGWEELVRASRDGAPFDAERYFSNYPLLFVCPPDEREIRITISQIHTHKIRGADILLFAAENADLRRAVMGRPDRAGEYRARYVVVPPGSRDAFVFQSAVLLQELALQMSIAKMETLDAAGVREHGVHPDVPKNVSKSITVD